MKLDTKSSTIQNLFILAFSLLCVVGLVTASTTSSTVASPSQEVATIQARFHSPMVTAIHQRRRAKKYGKKFNKKYGKKCGKKYAKKYGKKCGKKYAKKYGVTTKFKCTKTTTNGGRKVTKKCIHQYIFGDIQTANGSGRTPTPSNVPSDMPSLYPTSVPTSTPTLRPSSGPTTAPTSRPTTSPTTDPTVGPTFEPTSAPMELVTSSLSSRGSKASSSSKTVVGALVGGVLGFVVLAAGAKAVETVWRRNADRMDDEDSNHPPLEQA